MQRRDFCKLMAAAVVAKAAPAISQSNGVPGFNRYREDYAAFCATPPQERVFYRVSDGKIVETKLDEATWQPPACRTFGSDHIQFDFLSRSFPRSAFGWSPLFGLLSLRP
jgi:hypothetical protein